MLIGAVCLVLAIGIAYLIGIRNERSMVKFIEAEQQLIVKHDQYEIAFSRQNGGIAYVKQQGSEQPLSVGNASLWHVLLGETSSIQSAEAASFSYKWKQAERELQFFYQDPLPVEIRISFAEPQRIKLQASLENSSSEVIKGVRFPNELKVDEEIVRDGMLPMLPGAKLKGAFFTEHNSFADQYPGVMFASYLAIDTKLGGMAMYDVHDETILMTELGFKHQLQDPGKTSFVHNYKTWIEPGQKWESATVVVELGSHYEQSIVSYRELNGIDQYRSLAAKLGDTAEQYYELPLYKTDISALKDASWQSLSDNYIDKLNYNGIIHLVAFQQGGHDENYPDFLPPDPKWGGEAAFTDFVKRAQAAGNIMVPYTNMSWWGINAPTLKKLPDGVTLQELMVNRENGTIVQEDYGPHSGYVVNTGHPFFYERTAEEHRKLIEEAGFDGIFEDQWGIRNSPYVFNPAIPEGTDPSTAYFAGLRRYVEQLKHPLYMEDGTDVLADNSIGFMGSTYLWDVLGYRKNTATYTEYYPLSGMLLRDKVMQYHHNLAGETMTDNLDMLRWNAAMGYNLSVDLYHGVTNPWVDAAGVLQKHVLARYADERVVSFQQPAPDVSETKFESYTVTANWSKEQSYALNEQVELAPGGFHISSADDAVRAGHYTVYNGLELDAGEHLLVELRAADQIRVYQPIGSDTSLKIKKQADWAHTVATAYEANGRKIAELVASEAGDYVSFDYVSEIKGAKVGYVALVRSDQPSEAAEHFAKRPAEVNAALGKRATASSITADAFAAELTVDGDPFTYWESTANRFPQSLTLELDSAIKVRKVKLRLPPQDAWEARTQEIELLGSIDGTDYTTLYPRGSITYDPASGNEVELILEPAAEAKYIRLSIYANSAWSAAQLSEFEVYE